MKFAGNALEILILSRFCERLVSWNGYVLKENQRYGPSYPKVGRESGGGGLLKPPRPSPCATPDNSVIKQLPFMDGALV